MLGQAQKDLWMWSSVFTISRKLIQLISNYFDSILIDIKFDRVQFLLDNT